MTPGQSVRLTAAERATQREIGDSVGTVLDVKERAVQVSWRDRTSWVRREFVEVVER